MNAQNHAFCAGGDLSILIINYCHSCVTFPTAQHHPGWGVPRLGLRCPGSTLSEVLPCWRGQGSPALVLGNLVETIITSPSSGDLEKLDSELWVKSMSPRVLLTWHGSQRQRKHNSEALVTVLLSPSLSWMRTRPCSAAGDGQTVGRTQPCYHFLSGFGHLEINKGRDRKKN